MILLLSVLLLMLQQTTPMILQHDDIVTSAQWNTTETQIMTTSEDGTIRVWDAASGESVWMVTLESAVRGAAWNDDQSMILAWTTGGKVITLDAESGDILSTLPMNESRMIQGASWGDDSVLVWYENIVVMPSLRGEGEFAAANFSASHESRVLQAESIGDYILTYEVDGIAHIWDAATGEDTRAITFDDETLGVDWNADESEVITWGGSGAAMVWDIADHQQIIMRSLDHSRTFVSGAMWTSDETRIVSWGADETARVWDAATGDLLFSTRHEDWVTGAALNADETKLITWSFKSAYVWDISSGDLIASFTHDNLVSGGVFNADETKLLTWSWDGTARVWDMPN